VPSAARRAGIHLAAGPSTVTLEFEHGFDTHAALVDVINKLSQVPRLPPEADEPVVAPARATTRS